MVDNPEFVRWFNPWKAARPEGIAPIGWYVLADLEAAFTAGQADERQRIINEIRAVEQAGLDTWPSKD